MNALTLWSTCLHKFFSALYLAQTEAFYFYNDGLILLLLRLLLIVELNPITYLLKQKGGKNLLC